MDNGQIILFQTQGGETKIEVRLSNETVWLTADQMAELFQRDRSTYNGISKESTMMESKPPFELVQKMHKFKRKGNEG